MALSNRLKKTRIVTFKEDYKAGKNVVYKKGSEHAIHVDNLSILKDNGADFTSKKFDEEKIEKAKNVLEKAKKEEAKGE